MLKDIPKKFQYNSPVILTYTLICGAVLLLNYLTGGWTNIHLFSVYKTSFLDLMQYPRLISYIFGHANYQHFLSNFMVILLVGPMLEEKYGGKALMEMMGITAIVTGIVHVLFFSGGLLGASGIAFMLILLSSFVNIQKGKIPITVILVAIIYLSGEIINGLTANDNVSQMGHIIGGLCGTVFGWAITKGKDA
ncbi:MAG: rhomboid family intramembrane serine protease [Oscillospiraceae bacterium]|nr:rhomboid family intramembrane serine protease [Clostridia bacterium]MBR5372070.1 rhomboid family intramembrane serine protease [Oscillospiraceae bacterium]